MAFRTICTSSRPQTAALDAATQAVADHCGIESNLGKTRVMAAKEGSRNFLSNAARASLTRRVASTCEQLSHAALLECDLLLRIARP